MSRLGHNNPPVSLDPKETIKKKTKLCVVCGLQVALSVVVESALEVNTALELALLIPTAPQTHPPRPLLHHAAAPIPAFLCALLVVARLVRSPALLRRPVSTLAHSQPSLPPPQQVLFTK